MKCEMMIDMYVVERLTWPGGYQDGSRTSTPLLGRNLSCRLFPREVNGPAVKNDADRTIMEISSSTKRYHTCRPSAKKDSDSRSTVHLPAAAKRPSCLWASTSGLSSVKRSRRAELVVE